MLGLFYLLQDVVVNSLGDPDANIIFVVSDYTYDYQMFKIHM